MNFHAVSLAEHAGLELFSGDENNLQNSLKFVIISFMNVEAKLGPRELYLRAGLDIVVAERVLPHEIIVKDVIIAAARTRSAFTHIWPAVANYRQDLIDYYGLHDPGAYSPEVTSKTLDIIESNPRIREEPLKLIHSWMKTWLDNLVDDPLLHVRLHVSNVSDPDSVYAPTYEHIQKSTLSTSLYVRHIVAAVTHQERIKNDDAFLRAADSLQKGAARQRMGDIGISYVEAATRSLVSEAQLRNN